MATSEQCEQALHELADRLEANTSPGAHSQFDRSLSCRLTDLELSYTGRLEHGRLVDIAESEADAAQIRLEMSSDDLLALVDGRLNLATAWATGRVRVHAGVRDLIRLRSLF